MTDLLEPLRCLALAAEIAKKLMPAEIRRLMLELRQSADKNATLKALLRGVCPASLQAAEKEISICRDSKIRLLAYFDFDYPAGLLHIYDPPPILFVQGEIPERYNVALVGARKASTNGKKIAEELAASLTQAGAAVISGLAHGIDTAAHRGAIAAMRDLTPEKKFTFSPGVAVLGSGLLSIYPAANRQLAAEIVASGGALVSEFRPFEGPTKFNFPRRNRIIAALSDTVVVVEAQQKSGALITARCALEFGREVMAVPGAPNNSLSDGPNQLIRDGAAIICQLTDVLRLAPREKRQFIEFAESSLHPKYVAPAESPDTRVNSLRKLFQNEPELGFDRIVEFLGLPTAEVRAFLFEMELSGDIKLYEDGYYRLSNSLTERGISSNFSALR